MNERKNVFIYNIPRADAMGIVISDTKESALNKVKKQMPKFVNGPSMLNEAIEIVSWEEQEELEGSLLDDVLELIY